MTAITETLDWSQRFDFGGPRTRPIQGICIHTTENTPGTPAENVATFQLTSRSGSYHRLVDASGRVLIENTDDWTTWSTGNLGNDVLLHASCVARAALTRDQWLAETKMLDALAETVAMWSTEHDIPLVILNADDLVAGRRGIYGHDDTRIWGGTDHTDPGPGFPWDELVARARAFKERKVMSDTPPLAADVDARAQLVGSTIPGDYPGWEQLGGLTVVNALGAIGEKLGIPGFKDIRQ